MKGRIEFIKQVLEAEIDRLNEANKSFHCVNDWPDDDASRWFALSYTVEFILPEFERFEDYIFDQFNKHMQNRAEVEEFIENEMSFPCL